MLQVVGTVLNWYAKDPLWTRRLREKLTLTPEFNSPRRWKRFVTIRLGAKWSNMLNSGDVLSISISDNLDNPGIIGYARVRSLKKTRISALTKDELRKNIGAKNRKQVLADMQAVYNDISQSICPDTDITVIELEA